jgi:hypothetical protein
MQIVYSGRIGVVRLRENKTYKTESELPDWDVYRWPIISKSEIEEG